MKMTKFGKKAFYALSSVSPKLAQDSALPALVGESKRETFKRDQVKAKCLALDAAIDSEKLDDVLDAILDIEESPDPTTVEGVGDVNPGAEKAAEILKGKVDDATLKAIMDLFEPETAADEEKDDMVSKEEMKGAMDSLRQEMKDAEDARREVRPVVGDVLGMDSAEGIYGFALDQMKVPHEGVKGVPALKALFSVASTKTEITPKVAMDAAGLTSRFPNAARFR